MEAPYSVRVDADAALRLAKQGTSLLLLDVPPSLSFGIDLQMFVVGPNFKGMKMIPPGPHFVYYSPPSKEGYDTSAVTGFFLHANPSQVIVRRWDSQEERFVKLSDSSEEERYGVAVSNFEFDKNLAPYDIHHWKQWQELSKYITTSAIERFEPVEGDISVMAEAELVEHHPQTPAERRMIEQLKKAREMHSKSTQKHEVTTETKDMGGSGSGRCFYTHLPRLVKRPGADPTDLTSLNMDKSAVLEMVLKNNYEGSEELLLGELQFAFIAFLMGQSLESFSQWKAIVSLMLSCQEAPLRTHTKLFVKFLEVLYHQMKQSLKPDKSEPASDDSSWFSADNFFRLLFREFVLTLKNTQPVDGDLLSQAKRLKNLLETCLGWELDNEVSYTDNSENDEYAPVVVMEE